jgi:cystathionine beta-lyase
MKKEELLYARGVMPSIISIIRKLTKPLDNIVIQTPVYNAFFNVILNNNRKVLENKLTYKNYEYSINFKDLENKLKNPKTSLMLLCNPHNPIGKIWGKNDLEKIGSLCEKYNVILVSDEIHCDLTYPGKTYTPFASLASSIVDNSITCISPSKTFNIAGIQSAMVYIKNKELNLKVSQQLYADFSSEPNILSVEATITAYTQCREWLNQLKNTLLENKIIVEDFLKKELPSIKLVPVMPLTYYG